MNSMLVPITMFIMIPVTIIGTMLVRALAKKWDREAQQRLHPEVAARLERMEQAIDTIAVEVERIAEGQRFTTRLLSERGSAPAALPQDGSHVR